MIPRTLTCLTCPTYPTCSPISQTSRGSLSPAALVSGWIWVGSSQVCVEISKRKIDELRVACESEKSEDEPGGRHLRRSEGGKGREGAHQLSFVLKAKKCMLKCRRKTHRSSRCNRGEGSSFGRISACPRSREGRIERNEKEDGEVSWRKNSVDEIEEKSPS